MKVAIVGGTGAFGRGLAARWREAGVEITIGSRDAARAQERAAVLGVSGATNEEAVRDADLVVLAVQSSAAIDTARDLAPVIGAAPVLCVASELRFEKHGVFPARDAGSIAEDVAAIVAGPVVSGFQALPAAQLAQSGLLDEDVLVCGDDADSKQLVLELGQHLVSGRAIDAGPLPNARALEGMTAVIVHVNRKYQVVAGLKLTGFS
ncbi:MAG: NADPH-dependent F420 reductase [Actinobacteria bacterium]|nr:MAG: NADPH-dependent F420 reductase [Actinomycetota bacterium]